MVHLFDSTHKQTIRQTDSRRKPTDRQASETQ